MVYSVVRHGEVSSANNEDAAKILKFRNYSMNVTGEELIL